MTDTNKSTLHAIAENLNTFRYHPDSDKKKVSLKNTIDLIVSMEQNKLTQEMVTKLESMKYDGYSDIPWMRCRELLHRLNHLYRDLIQKEARPGTS